MIAFGLYGAIGFQFCLLVFLGLYLGYLGDKYFGTDPWLSLFGIVIGAAGGFYTLVKLVTWKSKNNKV